MKEWEPDDGHLRCITITTVVRFEYSGDGMKAAETEMTTAVDQLPDAAYFDVIEEILPTHIQYHLQQRRILNA